MDLFAYGFFAGLVVGALVLRLFLYDSRSAVSATAAAGTVRPAVDFKAAAAHGFSVKGDDNLQLIEGVGPKIEGLLNGAGLRTFADVANAGVGRLRDILAAAGPDFRLATPDTWVAQARLAAANDWATLRVLQDQLVGGVDRREAF